MTVLCLIVKPYPPNSLQASSLYIIDFLLLQKREFQDSYSYRHGQ